MTRKILEEAFIENYDFNNTDNYDMKVKMLSAMDSETLAAKVFNASMEM